MNYIRRRNQNDKDPTLGKIDKFDMLQAITR